MITLNYETAARDPIPTFEHLAASLGLHHVDRVRARAAQTSSGPTFNASSNQQHVLERDSAKSASAWRERLTSSEIDRVLARTERVRTELGATGVAFE